MVLALTHRFRAAALARRLLVVAVVLLALVALAGPVSAAPVPVPSPSATPAAGDPGCMAKAPGQIAWCMPWAVHVDIPPAGASSHWVTDCTTVTELSDRRACAAASISLDPVPAAGTASVLMDGPSTNGLSALVDCSLLIGPDRSGKPSQWTEKRTACTTLATSWAAQSYDPQPTAPCGTNVACQAAQAAQDAVATGIRAGIEGVVDLCVQGLVFALSKLAAWVFSSTAIAAPDEAFYFTYNAVAGVLILLTVVLFVISTIINGLRVGAGPSPVATLGGLVRAMLGITFAGGLAYLIVAAWDQAAIALLELNATTPFTGREWSNAFLALRASTDTLFIALVLSLFAFLGLLPLFVMMLFRGVLATGAALFGAWAMAGQSMSETRHWGRRWFWTVNALASSKFAVVALWVYGSRSAYGSDLWTALKAVLLIWLMVLAPYILLRLTAMWDGYLSDVNAHSVIAQANPIGIATNVVTGARSGGSAADDSDGDGAGGGGGGGGDSGGGGSGAAATMTANSATMPTTPGAGGIAGAAGGDATSTKAAAAAATGADGGNVGEPSTAATSQGDAQGEAGTGGENADEADGVEQGLRSARHDVAAGQLSPPGDTTGAGGHAPLVPNPGTPPSDPSGVAPTGAASGGAGPAAGGGSGGDGATGSGGGAGAREASAAGDLPIIPL